MIKLFVGLGNPGQEYSATRHNAGFWWLDALARELKVTLTSDRAFHGQAGRATIHGQTVWLLKPQTFMNLSGRSVSALARFYKIMPDEILVVHDELDLQPGTIRLKQGGGNGGHNGLKHIQETLGTDVYPRLRVGIGSNFGKGKQVNFVLGKWTEDEKAGLPGICEQCCDVVKSVVTVGVDRAQNTAAPKK